MADPPFNSKATFGRKTTDLVERMKRNQGWRLDNPGCAGGLPGTWNNLHAAFRRAARTVRFRIRRSEILTVPFRRALKPIYIRKLVRFIETVGASHGKS